MQRISTVRTRLPSPAERSSDELSPKPSDPSPHEISILPDEVAIFVDDEFKTLFKELVKGLTASTSDDHVLNFDFEEAAKDLFQQHGRKVPRGAEPTIMTEDRSTTSVQPDRIATRGEILNQNEFVARCLRDLDESVDRKNAAAGTRKLC